MAWLGTWAKRMEITVDNTNIDSDLTQFPVAINLGGSSGIYSADTTPVFDELTSDANRFKIAITKTDGTTQIYGDIEIWDDANEQAVIWVAKSDLDITTASVTTLYLYYDSTQSDNTTYIGDSGGTAAQSVWDSDFEAVYHMSQDPSGGSGCMLDSTSNNNNGTPTGTWATGDLVDADDLGKALDFEGSANYIDLSTGPAIVGTGDFTIEVAASTTSGAQRMLYNQRNSSTLDPSFYFQKHDNEDLQGVVATTAAQQGIEYDAPGMNNGDMHRHAFVRASDTGKVYFEGALGNSETEGSTVTLTSQECNIGRYTTGAYWWYGLISEVRLSTVERTAAWLKATHYSLTDELLSYKAEETETDAVEGWLGTWAKRIKITVDSTNIGTDLIQFPIPIVLGTSVGQDSQDLSGIFDELSDDGISEIEHTLTNPDAETGDSTGWTNETGSLNVTTASHEGTYAFNGGTSALTKAYQEVDIVTDGVSTTDIDNGIVSFKASWWQSSYEGSDDGTIILRFKNSSKVEISSETNYLTAPNAVWKDRSFESVMPALTRYVDVIIHCDRDSGTNNDARFDEIEAKSITRENSNSLKIAITQSNGLTQLYGDVELWDITNEKAVIYAGGYNHTLLTAEDTELYIYYDSAQSYNSTYISYSGDTPAQGVWDNKFNLVYHMAQDPSGGEGCLKDSTENENHGDTIRWMASSDLVDEGIGKGIDFNTENSFMRVPDASAWDSGLYTSTIAVSWDSNDCAFLVRGDNGESVATNYQQTDWGVSTATLSYETGGGTNRTSGPHTTASNARDGSLHILSSFVKPLVFKVGIDGAYIADQTIVTPDSTAPIELGPSNADIESMYGYDDSLGIVSEVRISNVYRTEDWETATYYSLIDDLLTYGVEEEFPLLPTYNNKKRITNHTNLRR